MRDFRDKVAVVTGGASGIGRALAERFARAGARLVLADIEGAALAATVADLEAADASVIGVVADVASAEAVESIRDRALDEYGAVHVVCNNAGVVGGGVIDSSLAVWDWVIGVNLMGVVHGIHTFLPLLLEQDEGHVVNTASLAGLGGVGGMGVYCATKSAVVGLSESLHHDLAARGSAVGVSVLCPGFVQTRIGDSARNAPPAVAAWAATEEAQLSREVGSQLAAAGIAPEIVADAVHDAIVDRRFFVVPHERSAVGMTRARMEWISGRAGAAARSEPLVVVVTARRQACTGGRWSIHGRAVSSCAATRRSRSSRPVAATSCTPMGRPSAQWRGTDIAGWPVTLKGTVNAAYGVAARIAPSASSPRISPSGAGGRAMVGVSRRSNPEPSSASHQRAVRRDQARNASTASRYASAVTARPSSACAQVSGSTSSAVERAAGQDGEATQVERGARGEHGAEVHEQREVVERRGVRGLHHVTQRAHQRGGVVGRGGARGVDGREAAGRDRRHHADAQPARFDADFVAVGAQRRWGGVRVAGFGPGEHVERGGAVADRTGEHVTDDQPGPRLAVVGAEGDATPRGLEAEEPARARRDADRTAAVAGVGERHHARRNRGRAATARSSGRPGEVPRIVRGAVGVRLGRRQQPELGCVRLPDDHASRGAESREEVRVVVGDDPEVAEEPVAEVERFAGERAVEVLDEDRYAAEGPVGRIVGLGAGALVAPVDHRVEVGVDRVDAFEGGVDELARREHTVAHQGGLIDRVEH